MKKKINDKERSLGNIISWSLAWLDTQNLPRENVELAGLDTLELDGLDTLEFARLDTLETDVYAPYYHDFVTTMIIPIDVT